MIYSVSDDMLGLSFQLASLEENAAIYLWVIRCIVLLVALYSLSKFSFDICKTLLIYQPFLSRQVVVELDRANTAGSESDLGQWKPSWSCFNDVPFSLSLMFFLEARTIGIPRLSHRASLRCHDFCDG